MRFGLTERRNPDYVYCLQFVTLLIFDTNVLAAQCEQADHPLVPAPS